MPRRRRLARLTQAERDELATAAPDRLLQLMWTTDGQWAELAHSAHVPWLEEPEALRELLLAFIREPLGKKL